MISARSLTVSDSTTKKSRLRILECLESHQTFIKCLPGTPVDISAGVSQLRAQPQQENSGAEFGGRDFVCVVCWGVTVAGQRAWRKGREDRQLACRQTNFSKLNFWPGSPLNACWGVRLVLSRKCWFWEWNAAFVKMGTHRDSLQFETEI